jgi:transcriptional regulator with XRE-family HTH domain
MRTFDDFLEEQLKDPEFRAEYEALEPEYEIIRAMIEARRTSGITQKQLSEKSGIAQGDISRIERASANPSLRTLKRLAAGMDMKLKLEFVPVGESNAERL